MREGKIKTRTLPREKKEPEERRWGRGIVAKKEAKEIMDRRNTETRKGS